MKRLQVFSQKSCESCDALKKFLQEMRIEFVDIDILSNHWAAELMIKNRLKTVPQIFFQDHLFLPGGYRTISTMQRYEILERMNSLGD